MKTLFASVLFLSFPLLFSVSPCQSQVRGDDYQLTLAQAYSLALKNHEGITIAEKEIAKSKQLPRKANAIMMPRLNVYGEYSRYNEPIDFQVNLNGYMLPPITTRPEEQTSMNINLVQPVYDGTWMPRRRQAQQMVSKSEKDYGWNAQNILFQVASIYYEILKNKQYVSITGQYLQRSQEENRIAKIKFVEGAVTEDAVLSTELKISSARTRLLTEKNNVRLAQKSLSLLVGDIPEEFEVEEPEELKLKSENFEELLGGAQQDRMDYRSAQLSVEAARSDMEANKARYQPSLEGSWNYYAINNPSYDQEDNYWIAALRLKIPLYDGGIRSSDLETSRQTLAQAQLNSKRLEKEIRNDIEKTLLTIQTNRSILESLTKQLETAKKNYDIVFSKFKYGAAGTVDLNQALDSLDKANRDLITSKYDQQVALLEQEKATGIFLNGIINQKLALSENY
jgi:outer membrane protein